MALDWWGGGAFAGGDTVPAGRIKAVQLALARVRAPPTQSDESDRNGLGVLRHGVADRPRHAGTGQGLIAAQTTAQRDQLLDRATPAGAQARVDEGPVLRGKRYGLCGGALAFYARPQEILVTAHPRRDDIVRRAGAADQGLGGCAIRLYVVLAVSRCGSSASRPSITTAQLRW